MHAIAQNLPSAVDIGGPQDLSDKVIPIEFQAISRNLTNVTNLTSSHIPYRQLRDQIQQALTSPSITSHTILDASTLFLQLVKRIPIAYDELTTASCFQQALHILKTSQSPCPDGCNASAFLCGLTGHTPLDKFEHFWREVTALLCCTAFDVQKPAFLGIVINALGDLIRYSSGSWHQPLVSHILTALLNRTRIQNHATIYKMAFSLLRLSLPAQNRETLLNLLQTAGSRELSGFQRSTSRASDESSLSDDRDDGAEPEENTLEVNKNGQEPPILRLPILRFLELCCFHVLDRADQRLWLCNAIVRILCHLDPAHVQSFRSFILKLSRHPKGRVRLFIAELAPRLVSVSFSGEDAAAIDLLLWIDMLASRSNDCTSSVRVKAISSLIDVLKHLGSSSCDDVVIEKLVSVAFAIRQRLQDPKARVRKSAVDYFGLVTQLLLSKARDSSHHMPQKDIECAMVVPALEDTIWQLGSPLRERGNDAVSNVRLAAINQATAILLSTGNYISEKLLQQLLDLWCEIVLPRVNDSDTRCKEACLKSVQEILFSPRKNTTHESDVPWQVCDTADRFPALILSAMGGENLIAADLLKSVLNTLCKNGNLGISDIRTLCAKTKLFISNDAHPFATRSGSWTAIAELAACGKADVVKHSLGLDVIMQQAISHNNRNACRIAKNLVHLMNRTVKETWSAALKNEIYCDRKLRDKNFDRKWIPAAVNLLASLETEDGDSLLEQCRKRILTFTGDVETETIENILVIVGEICLSFPLLRPPAETIITYVRALTSSTSKYPRLRALALTTLGKVCLCQGAQQVCEQDQVGEITVREKASNVNAIGESMARRNISIFVHELDNATSSATRNNAVLVLCDLCRVYTAVVEPYLPRLAGLLSNPSEFVRIQVLSSLVGLLQEDYIKVRGGAILYQITDCLLDSCESVRSMAEYCLLHVMTPKHPSVLATSFIELIFVLNSCTDCQIYNHNQASPQKRRFQSIDTGEFDERLKIYSVFLSGMTLEQRIRLPGRFRSDILGLIVDSKLDVSKSSVQAVLRDTLLLFCNDKLRCTSDFRAAENDAYNPSQEDGAMQREGTGAENMQLTKKLNLLNKVQMVELRETTIPALLEIRHRLEKMRSPLLKVLMRSFCRLLQPHRKELESVIRDPVVRSEVMHEMSAQGQKKLARSEKARKESESPRLRSVGTKWGKEESPMNVKSMSVPRTRRGVKARKISFADVQSDDDEPLEMNNGKRNGSLSKRIAASPKLAAIAGRCRGEDTFAMSSDDKRSGFAQALARIEDAAESDMTS